MIDTSRLINYLLFICSTLLAVNIFAQAEQLVQQTESEQTTNDTTVIAAEGGANPGELVPILGQHTVVAGDTLSSLAKAYLGEDAPWDTNLE